MRSILIGILSLSCFGCGLENDKTCRKLESDYNQIVVNTSIPTMGCDRINGGCPNFR